MMILICVAHFRNQGGWIPDHMEPVRELGWQLQLSNAYHECFLSVIRYGFRSPPHLELKARPKLGEREVTLVHVTEWIEKKLDQEFQVQSGKMENSAY